MGTSGDARHGYVHKQARKRALEAFVDGTRCRYCRKPMHAWQALDLDHVKPVVLGGIDGPTVLTHASCNRRAGMQLLNRLQHGKRYPRRTKRTKRW